MEMEQRTDNTGSSESRKIKTVCVLAMHSSGSSLVASILDALGVKMNPNPKAKVRWYQNYEDADFVKLNIRLLLAAGGEWKKAPDYDRVSRLAEKENLTSQIQRLVARKSNGVLWGFKDPRTALTIQLIHPYLVDPGYIRVVRSERDIAKSIMKRGGTGKTDINRWIKLAKDYHSHIDRFLAGVDSPVLQVSFDKLLDQKNSRIEIKRIASFVGVSQGIGAALKRINYKRE